MWSSNMVSLPASTFLPWLPALAFFDDGLEQVSSSKPFPPKDEFVSALSQYTITESNVGPCLYAIFQFYMRLFLTILRSGCGWGWFDWLCRTSFGFVYSVLKCADYIVRQVSTSLYPFVLLISGYCFHPLYSNLLNSKFIPSSFSPVLGSILKMVQMCWYGSSRKLVDFSSPFHFTTNASHLLNTRESHTTHLLHYLFPLPSDALSVETPLSSSLTTSVAYCSL